jgi:hypothetical protein
LQIFEAEADGDGLGVGRGIPDINGDGNVDLILAAWTSSAGTPSGGKVYVHSGADGALLHTVTGAIEGDSLGVDALWVGDVNGDDNPDYMVTGVGNDFNGTDVGHVYIVSFVQQPALTLQPGLAGCHQSFYPAHPCFIAIVLAQCLLNAPLFFAFDLHREMDILYLQGKLTLILW